MSVDKFGRTNVSTGKTTRVFTTNYNINIIDKKIENLRLEFQNTIKALLDEWNNKDFLTKKQFGIEKAGLSTLENLSTAISLINESVVSNERWEEEKKRLWHLVNSDREKFMSKKEFSIEKAGLSTLENLSTAISVINESMISNDQWEVEKKKIIDLVNSDREKFVSKKEFSIEKAGLSTLENLSTAIRVINESTVSNDRWNEEKKKIWEFVNNDRENFVSKKEFSIEKAGLSTLENLNTAIRIINENKISNDQWDEEKKNLVTTRQFYIEKAGMTSLENLNTAISVLKASIPDYLFEDQIFKSYLNDTLIRFAYYIIGKCVLALRTFNWRELQERGLREEHVLGEFYRQIGLSEPANKYNDKDFITEEQRRLMMRYAGYKRST